MAQRREGPGQFWVRTDVEPVEPVVEKSDESTRKVRRVRHPRAVLAGVEEDQTFPVLDDIRVDGERFRPLVGGDEPKVDVLLCGTDVFRLYFFCSCPDHRET